jgi:hypothetical protein
VSALGRFGLRNSVSKFKSGFPDCYKDILFKGREYKHISFNRFFPWFIKVLNIYT